MPLRRYDALLFLAAGTLLFFVGELVFGLFEARYGVASALAWPAKIGLMMTALIAGSSVLMLTIHLIRNLFFPHLAIKNPLGQVTHSVQPRAQASKQTDVAARQELAETDVVASTSAQAWAEREAAIDGNMNREVGSLSDPKVKAALEAIPKRVG